MGQRRQLKAMAAAAALATLPGCEANLQGPLGPPYLVREIAPGEEGSSPYYLTDVQGTLFFVADDGVHGPELWRSDGTEAGTDLVKDIHPSREASCSGCSRYEPSSLTRVGRRLFFVGDDD